MVTNGILITSDSENEIELHKLHLEEYDKVYWGSKFYVKSDNFYCPINAYIYVNQIGVCYKFFIESIESNNKKFLPEFQQFICDHYFDYNNMPKHRTWWLVNDIRKIGLIKLSEITKINGESLDDDFPPRSCAIIKDNIKVKELTKYV